jgi:hypothetical protein
MIKRLVFALVLLAAPLLAFGDATNRALLLTNDGTLYTIESAYTEDLGIQSPSTQVLVLTTRDDQNDTTTSIVPETLLGGSHTNPALAYDSASKSLFIFWQRAISNGMSSDLVFCSYSNGKWSEATSVDSAKYHYSRNIQIAVTHQIDQIDEKGAHSSVKGLTVHAVWWEDRPTSSLNPWARYAMLTIENGLLTDIQVADLSLYTDISKDVATPQDDAFNTEVLRHPAIFESAGHASVDVLFGDIVANNMHRVTIVPTLVLKAGSNGGRLRIPVGVRDTGMAAPKFRSETDARVTAIAGDKDKVVLYTNAKTGVSYVTYADGVWSPQRTLAVDDKMSADAAVEVLRRMVNAE